MNSIPYIIFTLILFFLYACETRKIKCGLTIKSVQNIAFVLLLVFIGLRGFVYSDFVAYYTFYEDLPNIFNLSSNDIADNIWEPGFIVYSSIIKTIIPNYFGWVFINTLIDLLVLRAFFKRYSSSLILPFIFFIAFSGLFMEFNLYRNTKAFSLFLLSIPYLEKRKMLPYMLLNILGATFHASSLIYLPCYWILTKNVPKVVVIGSSVVACVLYLLNIPLVGDLFNSMEAFQALEFYDKLNNHIENATVYTIGILRFVELLFAMLVFTMLYDKLCNKSKAIILFYNAFWLYFISYLLFYEVRVLIDRIPILFVFGCWILYPQVVSMKTKYRQLIYAFSILLVFIKIYTANTNPAAKYDNILTGIESYETRKTIYQKFDRSLE